MLIYHYSTKIHNKWELRKNGAPNCIKIIFIIIKIYFFMRSNVNFFGLCLVISIKFITFVVQIRTFTCDDANSPTPKSLEKVAVGRGQT